MKRVGVVRGVDGDTTLFSRLQPPPILPFPDRHFPGLPRVCVLSIRTSGICIERVPGVTRQNMAVWDSAVRELKNTAESWSLRQEQTGPDPAADRSSGTKPFPAAGLSVLLEERKTSHSAANRRCSARFANLRADDIRCFPQSFPSATHMHPCTRAHAPRGLRTQLPLLGSARPFDLLSRGQRRRRG